jgi:DNA-binding transcriptional regulator of glucitol operon
MQQADFDHTLFESGNNKGDSSLLVKFFIKVMPDNEASAAEARAIFKDVEYVDIRVAGSRSSHVCRPARQGDIERFPKHYEAFKQRKEIPLEGTPLVEWAQISRSQAEELSFLNVKTVEQLAAMSDNYAGQRMGGYELKARAIAWLVAAKESKIPLALVEKLKTAETRADKAEERANALEASLQQLEAKLHSLSPSPHIDEEDDDIEAAEPVEAATIPRRKRVTKG